ncbi:MAG: CRISPR system precrRNA processing endoribonuclease RAMP protein Cas6 [Acidobacteriota bacterium]
MTLLPLLPLARYQLRFECSGAGRLPEYLGSAWRGILGRALKNTVCVTRLPSCPPCLLYRSCPYPYIFETPPPFTAQKMRKYTAAPHPFLLDLTRAPENGVHQLGLTLIGRGNAYLPYLIHAFQRGGEAGLGKSRLPMKLMEVRQADPPEADLWKTIYEAGGLLSPSPPVVPHSPPAPPAVRLRLQTPIRLQRGERLVTPEAFRFSDLFGPLLRRVSMLTYFHTEAPLETDFSGLMEQSRQIEPVTRRLAWKDWTRYSSRQKTTMQMGGLVGDMVLALPEGSPLWPYLWLGQWLHAGKGTSMGLGQYTISSASLPNEMLPEA